MDDSIAHMLPDPAGYARRIGMGWPLEPDLGTLGRIIYQHQCTVPFENLDCYDLRVTPSTAPADLYGKIVTENRGGYCFELNAALLAFLRDCGYDAWPISCCILRGRDYIPSMLHRATIVEVDGTRYYCDVGYGGPQPAGPVPLGGRLDILGETFFAEKGDGPWWNLDRITSRGDRERVIGFWDVPMSETYFEPYNYYCATNKASLFQQKRLLNLRTPEGSLAITGTSMTEHRGREVTVTELESPEALSDAIRSRFGFQFPADGFRLSD